MAAITLTEANPAITKAAGGGGRQSPVLTEATPTLYFYYPPTPITDPATNISLAEQWLARN